MIGFDDLERLMDDPVKNHERIMQKLQPTLPSVIYKDFVGKQPSLDVNGDEPPPFTDEQVDIVAAAMAELRVEMRIEFQDMLDSALGSLTEQLATVQGQVSVLLNLIGALVNGNNNGNGSSSKSVEAIETSNSTRESATQ